MTAMKKEYDFSKGERGKFFHPKAELNLPIYLSKENLQFVETIAKKKSESLNDVVNALIKSDMQLAKAIN